MKKSKFSETQIVKAIKENESGRSVDDICRELGIAKGTFYNWYNRHANNQLKMNDLNAPRMQAQQFPG